MIDVPESLLEHNIIILKRSNMKYRSITYHAEAPFYGSVKSISIILCKGFVKTLPILLFLIRLGNKVLRKLILMFADDF